jgi:hypothetical protein
VDNWKKLTNSRNRVRKKSFGGEFCFSNRHIIGLDTGGLVFLVSDYNYIKQVRTIVTTGAVVNNVIEFPDHNDHGKQWAQTCKVSLKKVERLRA